jgi:hypothetical protein
MIPYPTVEPGDTGKAVAYSMKWTMLTVISIVFWSADTIHGTEMENSGDIDACVFYIPSVPLTPNNAVRPLLMLLGTYTWHLALTAHSNISRSNARLS